MQGKAERAMEVFSMLNPIRRTHDARRRAALQGRALRGGRGRLLREAPHDGRGGWTWYTGSAGWLYRAGLEWILGFRLRENQLCSRPACRRTGRDSRFTISHRGTPYVIYLSSANPRPECPRRSSRSMASLLKPGRNVVDLVADGASHTVHVTWLAAAETGDVAATSSADFRARAPVRRFRRHNRRPHDRPARSPRAGLLHPRAPA